MITKLQYVEFLMSTVANYTGTYLAEHLDAVSHDTITDFLQSEKLTARHLWELVGNLIVDSPDAFLLADDSVQDKRYSRFIELVRRQYSGAEHGLVRGIGVVNLVHSSGKPAEFYPQMLFGLLSSRMLPAQPNAGHSAIARYVRNKPDSDIVTTNYDCCMDLALQKNEAGFSYLVEFAHRKVAQDHVTNAVSLIKLHGSLNWFYCGTCQQVHLIDIAKTVDENMRDESCYSVIAVCKDCGGQRRGLLVPPLAMKFDVAPPLTPLIEKAQDSFNKADIIVAVGFSFADADMYISRMLTKSLQHNQNVRVVVFDPDFNVVNKLRRQLALRIPSFEPRRIIRVSGDCSKTLPDFLDGKYRDAGANEGKAGRVKRKVENAIAVRE